MTSREKAALTRSSVRAKLVDCIQEFTGAATDSIHDSDNFTNDLGLDSLDCVELVMSIEETFDIAIGDDWIERVKTVGEAVHTLCEEVGAVND